MPASAAGAASLRTPASFADSTATGTPRPGGTLQLQLTENTDILGAVASRAKAPYCVGFAAETEDLLNNATAKRLRKGIPLLVANLAPSAFYNDENELLLVDAQGAQMLPRGGKDALARRLVKELAWRLSATNPNR